MDTLKETICIICNLIGIHYFLTCLLLKGTGFIWLLGHPGVLSLFRVFINYDVFYLWRGRSTVEVLLRLSIWTLGGRLLKPVHLVMCLIYFTENLWCPLSNIIRIDCNLRYHRFWRFDTGIEVWLSFVYRRCRFNFELNRRWPILPGWISFGFAECNDSSLIIIPGIHCILCLLNFLLYGGSVWPADL